MQFGKLNLIKDKLDNYLTEGNGNNVENLMVNILGTNIINMDFAFEIKIVSECVNFY